MGYFLNIQPAWVLHGPSVVQPSWTEWALRGWPALDSSGFARRRCTVTAWANPCTLNGVTRSGHVKYQEKPLACKLRGNSAWKIICFYLLYSQLHILMPSGHVLIRCMLSCIINDEHIFLSFGKDLHGQSSCHLQMAFQLLQNMASGHVKVKKRTDHVFYMVTPSHATESVSNPCWPMPNQHYMDGIGMQFLRIPNRNNP